MATTKTYDSEQVTVIVGSRSIRGFATDSKVKIERTSDAWTSQVGVSGEVTRSKSNDKSGKITISLMQSSDDNSYLDGIRNADELSNTGLTSIMVHDSQGGSTHVAAESWISKMPETEYNKEAKTREWVFMTGPMVDTLAGNQ